jgi:hypothetical protein
MEEKSRGRLARQAIRYLIAIATAILVGEVAQVAAAGFMYLFVGDEVGGQWSLNIPNVIVMIIVGAAIGSVAGAIAKKRGMLVAAIAALLPFETFISLILDRDLSALYASKAALWAWVALGPAMICGRLFAKGLGPHVLVADEVIE